MTGLKSTQNYKKPFVINTRLPGQSLRGIRQRGSILLYGLLALAVVTICGGVVYTYQNAIVRAERAERDLGVLQTAHQEQLTENHNLKIAGDRKDKLLAARQTERNTADNIERAINAKLSEIYRTSEPARTWRDAAVPADVLRGLRAEPAAGGSAQDGKGTPAVKPAAAKPGR